MMTPGFKSSETNQTLQRPIKKKKNQGMTIKNQIKKYVYPFLFLI